MTWVHCGFLRAATAARFTCTSRNTPPLTSVRKGSIVRQCVGASPLLCHYSATTHAWAEETFFIYLNPYDCNFIGVIPDQSELHARLLEDARNYDPTAHHRGLLAPYRDVLLLWRAKFMSYEQIAATLNSHGIRVSPAGVGVFCRGQFTKAQIQRARREVRTMPRPAAAAPVSAAVPAAKVPAPTESIPGRRGPKIARDNY